MAKYIERDALLEKFFSDTRFGFYGEFTDGSEIAYTSAEVKAIIVNAPAVDVEERLHQIGFEFTDEDWRKGFS